MTIRTFPGVVTSVHDGDSARVLVDLGFRLFEDVHVRLAGTNAAELATPGGKAARDHLATLAPHGAKVTLICHGPDKYGRWLGDLITPAGVNIAQQMITDGFAAHWDGKGHPAPTPPWPIP